MKRSTTRWTTALAATALLALPATGLAQSTGQPPTQTPPPTTGTPSNPAQPPAPGAQPDQEAAKQHLTAARNSLSEMTQLPAASQLTGDARTQVSQLITNFNELITTNSEWRNSYEKVQSNLTALIGSAAADESAAPTSGTEGAVGTSGTVAVDPEIKAKLIEFRNHLDKFEKAAGGPSATPSTSGSPTSGSPATGSPSMAGAPGAPDTTTSSAVTGAASTPQTGQAQSPYMDQHELLRHVQAIEAILNVQGPAAAGTTGTPPTGTTTGDPTGTTQSGVTLSAAQVDQLRTHLSELKRLLNQR